MSNLDKQIKSKGESFTLQPRPQVWKRVESELDKQNRGRLIGWWWLTPVVIIAWGFAFYFHDRSDKKAFYDQAAIHLPLSVSSKAGQIDSRVAKATEAMKPVKDISEKPAVLKGKTTIQQTGSETTNPVSKVNFNNKKSLTVKVNAANNTNTEETSVSKTKIKKSKTALPGSTVENVFATSVKPEKKASKTEPSLIIKPQDEKIESQTKQTLSVPDEKSIPPATPNPVNSTVNQPVGKNTVSHSNAYKSVAIGNAVKKDVTWRFSIGGGISLNEKKLFFKSPKDTTDPNGGSTGGGVPIMYDNKPDFSILTGAERLQQIGRRWQWQAGLKFQYQQMKQPTGELQSYQVLPNPPDWSYSSFYYVDPGKDFQRKGENFRVLISNDLAYAVVLNKRSIFLKGGFYAGANIYNHYLLPDEIQYWLIPGSNQTYNTWFAGISTGIEYRLKNGSGISLLGMYDLTQAHQPLAKNKYFWRSATINYSLPLNFK